jgi:hypothetical protein
MIAVAWGGVLLMMVSAVLAVVARRRVWSMRLNAPAESTKIPEGSILLAARAVRGVTREVTPLLSDWIARGVLEVSQTGGEPSAGRSDSFASGPEWHFTVLDASTVGPVELPVLRAFVPEAPAAGAEFTLLQRDARTRDRIFDAIHAGTVRQRAAFGPKPLGESLIAVGLVALSIAGTVAAVGGLVVGGVGPVPIAFAVAGGLVAVATVLIASSSRHRPSNAEREYRQDLINMESWIRSVTTPDPRLAGWAMIWDLPGAWPHALPPSILLLRRRDPDFLRGDFSRRSPEPAPL